MAEIGDAEIKRKGVAVEMNRCHFWLARFRDRAAVDEYMRETVPYPEDGPISRFAADQGKRFYDHDWVFAEFDEKGNLDNMLQTIKAPDTTRVLVLASAAEVSFSCNAVLVADEGEFSDPVSVTIGEYQLAYVGCHALWG